MVDFLVQYTQSEIGRGTGAYSSTMTIAVRNQCSITLSIKPSRCALSRKPTFFSTVRTHSDGSRPASVQAARQPTWRAASSLDEKLKLLAPSGGSYG